MVDVVALAEEFALVYHETRKKEDGQTHSKALVTLMRMNLTLFEVLAHPRPVHRIETLVKRLPRSFDWYEHLADSSAFDIAVAVGHIAVDIVVGIELADGEAKLDNQDIVAASALVYQKHTPAWEANVGPAFDTAAEVDTQALAGALA